VATELLYHQDSLLLSFEAEVIEHVRSEDGRSSVVLDRTAFYPEAGGQMADRGLLAGRAIADVQIDEQGRVRHFVDGEPPPIGARVSGEIDRVRRKTFMALHTAQHMLSRALVDVANAETVSARLGEASCTIDLGVASLPERDLARAQDLTNTVIDDDLSVRAWFPEKGELDSLPLRRRPKVEENVRVVAIGEFDFSPCGGTHCKTTAQVGLVEVLGVERYKGMTRVTFDAGRRARAMLSAESKALRQLAAGFTCGPLDVSGAIERLRSDLSQLKQTARRLGERAAGEIARELVESSPAETVIAVIEGDKDLLKAVGARIVDDAGKTALLAVEAEDGLQVLAARGPNSKLDCGALVKSVAAASGGKGGGRPDRAEGRLPKGADWRALVAAALEV
jgi:alanyl-tRNA synthetase